MRLAAVDIGSNTVHSLVVDADGNQLIDVAHFVEMPALGAEVARTGRIGSVKAKEAITALIRVVAQSRGYQFSRLLAGATEAVRRAADGSQFLREAGAALGQTVNLISPQREAELSFAGVASDQSSRDHWLMADLGGGSTELVIAEGRRMLSWRSLSIGSGVLSERHLSDPPAPGERENLRSEALKLLSEAPTREPTKLVVTGGTASNLPRIVSQQRPPLVLSREALLRAEERLDGGPAAALADAYALPADRIRALRGGVEVLLLLLDWAGLDHLHVSHRGLRHGMVLAYLERGEAWC